MSRRRIVVIGGTIAGAVCVLFGLILVACSVPSSDKVVSTASPTETQRQTETIWPTKTSAPTQTPRPTSTPRPTLTSTPIPEMILFEGSGDSVVDIDKWDGPAFVHIVGNGAHNFAVINRDAAGETIDLLVNEIGNYNGYHLIDYRGDEQTARFEITASGPWTISVIPLGPDYIQYLHIAEVPGIYQAKGNDVVILYPTNGDTAAFQHDGEHNFAVESLGRGGMDLLVNEIGPYQGTVQLPRETMLLIVTADGNWSVQISQR